MTMRVLVYLAIAGWAGLLAAAAIDLFEVRDALIHHPRPLLERSLRPRQAANKTIEDCALICNNAYDSGAVNKFLSCSLNDQLGCQCRASEAVSSPCLGCVLKVSDTGYTPVQFFEACKLIPEVPTEQSCQVVCSSAGDQAAVAALTAANQDSAAVCAAFRSFTDLQCPDCLLAATVPSPGTAQDVLIACAEGGFFSPGQGPSSSAGATGEPLGGITVLSGIGVLPTDPSLNGSIFSTTASTKAASSTGVNGTGAPRTSSLSPPGVNQTSSIVGSPSPSPSQGANTGGSSGRVSHYWLAALIAPSLATTLLSML